MPMHGFAYVLNFYSLTIDPANAAIITQCGGIPLIIQCLSSPVRNTVSMAYLTHP